MQSEIASQNAVRRLSPDTIRLDRRLPGPIERVWAYLVEAEKRKQWFAGGEFEPRKGGRGTLHFYHANITDEPTPERYAAMDDGGFHSAITVLAFDPPGLLAYTWPENGHVSEVTFELSTYDDEVLLVLTHRRIGSVANMASFASGWETHFDALQDVLAGTRPQGFWASAMRREQEYLHAFDGDAA